MEEQYSYLEQNNCDRVQGFLVGKPVCEAKAVALLDKDILF